MNLLLLPCTDFKISKQFTTNFCVGKEVTNVESNDREPTQDLRGLQRGKIFSFSLTGFLNASPLYHATHTSMAGDLIEPLLNIYCESGISNITSAVNSPGGL